MFLRSAHIRHYKSLDDVRVEFTQPITVIVGPNAVGKTNLLEGIQLVWITALTLSRGDMRQNILQLDRIRALPNPEGATQYAIPC